MFTNCADDLVRGKFEFLLGTLVPHSAKFETGKMFAVRERPAQVMNGDSHLCAHMKKTQDRAALPDVERKTHL